MKTRFADYSNSLVNLTCSAQKHFGITPKHSTLAAVDEVLEKGNHRNVVFLLFDGMGANLLQRILGDDCFFSRHKVGEMSSVLPSTTTAATTTVISGLTPYEHGWIGWDVYFKEVDKIVTLYPNTIKDTRIPAADYHVAQRYAPYKDMMHQVSEVEGARGEGIQPFGEGIVYSNKDDMFGYIEQVCAEEGRHFIYAYSDEPDSTFHREGTESAKAKEYLLHVNEMTEQLCSRLTDTLVIVFADHGHLNVQPMFVSDYPELAALLERGTSVEPRCCSFKVRAGSEARFERLFAKHFGKYFTLFSAEQVLQQKLFGDGEPAPNFLTAIGDYIAVATADRFILNDRTLYVHKSAHAGITEDEMLVPLIMIDCK
ncbi:MAG: alkaline phosphatase family protein [Oscillospiraceae bacterium]|nr:alkaline phosphatase family protein [Oscillospiraceae bacterium]